jgi:predicted nuclease with RNAse H fold
MLTVGVDLAAEPKGTAVARVEWGAGQAVVRRVACPADDEVVLAALAEADKAGIDCPLGWPDDFVAFVRDHQRGAATVPGGYPGPGWKQRLTMRLTDRVVKVETGKTPLSVSTDLIGHVALRCACLLAEHAARGGQPVDRAGDGTVVEVYPAASLRVWGLEPGKYKQRAGAPYLDALVDQVRQHAPWLDFGAAEGECRSRHDAFDAVIAALTARAAALGDLTLRPRTPEEAAAAVTEGWVAVPLRGTRLGQLVEQAPLALLAHTDRAVQVGQDGGGDAGAAGGQGGSTSAAAAGWHLHAMPATGRRRRRDLRR